jgi:hypothetical protein
MRTINDLGAKISAIIVKNNDVRDFEIAEMIMEINNLRPLGRPTFGPSLQLSGFTLLPPNVKEQPRGRQPNAL